MTLTQGPPYTGEQHKSVIGVVHHAPACEMHALSFVLSRHICD